MGGVITVIVESDEEHQAADEALAAGRLDFGAHSFVIRRESRRGPGGNAGITVSVGPGCSGGGGSGGVRLSAGPPWQMPPPLPPVSEAAWRSPDEIRAMEQRPGGAS